jgi:hypothetical protein
VNNTQYVLALLASIVAVALIFAYISIGEVTAIKGTYVLFGIIVASFLYREGAETIKTESHQLGQPDRINRWCIKAVLIIVSATFLVTYVTGVRLVPVAISLSIGYTLVAYQLILGRINETMTYQLALLFLIGPVTKYLTTGFYSVFCHRTCAQ